VPLLDLQDKLRLHKIPSQYKINDLDTTNRDFACAHSFEDDKRRLGPIETVLSRHLPANSRTKGRVQSGKGTYFRMPKGIGI
jgi:hypothetical protein